MLPDHDSLDSLPAAGEPSRRGHVTLCNQTNGGHIVTGANGLSETSSNVCLFSDVDVKGHAEAVVIYILINFHKYYVASLFLTVVFCFGVKELTYTQRQT